MRIPAYEDIAIQCYSQFLAIANTIAGHTGAGVSLWDDVDGFFKDLVVEPNGDVHRIEVFSWVGIIPLFRLRGGGCALACELETLYRLALGAQRRHV